VLVRPTLLDKGLLAVRIWARFVVVRAMLGRRPLPVLVRRLGQPARRSRRQFSSAFLSRAVNRSLHLGKRRPTCLVSSLVLFRLLREQDDEAELVIGLPSAAATKDAHAWVELDGADVGPPPGRGGHEAFARYG
jgi:hypothetical protein